MSSSQTLANHRDLYYTAEVEIGSPGEHFWLTVDTRTSAVIVAASDNMLSTFSGRSTFNSSSSTSFHFTSKDDRFAPNATGTDMVDTITTLQPRPFPIEIVYGERGLDPLFKPFLAQPSDGIFYIYGYAMWTTMYLPKECVMYSKLSQAFISYGAVNASACSSMQEFGPVDFKCVIPYVAIDGIRFGADDGEENTVNIHVNAFIMPIPEIVLPKVKKNLCPTWLTKELPVVFDNFTSDLHLNWSDSGAVYIIDCKVDVDKMLVIQVLNTSYTIPMVYLVDKLSSDFCVLRMRPLDPEKGNYCSTVCGMPSNCTHSSFILGLPFLHRYCVSYDPAMGRVGLSNLLTAGSDDGHQSICDYSKFYPTASTTPSSTGASVPTWVVGVSISFALIVIIATSGALCWRWKRRNKCRRKIIADMTKKYESVRHNNAYVTSPAVSRDKWELLPSDVKVFFSNKIGSGAFADVYKGRLVEEKLEVGIKLAKNASTEARQDLQREIDFMKDLGTHVHVLSILGHTALEDHRLALVLEFCSNGDLSNWLISHDSCINRVPLGKDKCELHVEGDHSTIEKQLSSFAWQVADGLVYLVSRSLIHRDIAARNVLLTSDLTAKISDFGLCRRSEGNVYNTRYGKLPIKWMAPEALRTGTFTPKTDVWSFGVLLYEIYAAGSLPFPHVQPYEQLGVLERGERPAQPNACPDNVYDLMRRCWQAEPDERPTALEVKLYLEGIIGSTSAAYGYFDFGNVDDTSDDKAAISV